MKKKNWQHWMSRWQQHTTLVRCASGLAVVLGVGVGLAQLHPAKADNTIDPKLRQQVLQIIRENPEVILESVQNYQAQRDQRQKQAQEGILSQIQTNPKAAIGQSPTKGAVNGKVVLFEFSDFQCPYCGKAEGTIKQFLAKYGDQVTFVYKHFPLTAIHPEALPAAKAAWAAGQQGKFWQFHDALFANQGQLGDPLYRSIAQNLKLDLQRFNRDRASAAAQAAIEQDIQLAEQIGVDATPFFVMNGVPFAGAVDLSEMEKMLKQVQK
ncbi:MAG: thioredoxin domain-containing protein [Leptolyngbyaceae cyanobacterium]